MSSYRIIIIELSADNIKGELAIIAYSGERRHDAASKLFAIEAMPNNNEKIQKVLTAVARLSRLFCKGFDDKYIAVVVTTEIIADSLAVVI